MSEEEGAFLARWSRRKEEARKAERALLEETEAPPPEPAPEEFDPASLPPIEALDGGSDYTAFLRLGVPKALRDAALRKAWATDASITGHKPLVDYDWDFNAPGYAALRPTDDPKRLVAGLFRHLRRDAPDEAPSAARPTGEDPGSGSETAGAAEPAAPPDPGADAPDEPLPPPEQDVAGLPWPRPGRAPPT